jgi:hypothetical protein
MRVHVRVIAAGQGEGDARNAVEAFHRPRQALPDVDDLVRGRFGQILEVGRMLARDDLGMPG